jgi:lysophospholipase L1-like esterase
MTEMIALIRDRSPETRIVLITPGPCQISRTKANFYDNKTPPQAMNRSNEQVKQYVDAVKEIGATTNLPVIDVWSAIWAAAGSDDDDALEPFFSDGLHLAAPGYKVSSSFNPIITGSTSL